MSFRLLVETASPGPLRAPCPIIDDKDEKDEEDGEDDKDDDDDNRCGRHALLAIRKQCTLLVQGIIVP